MLFPNDNHPSDTPHSDSGRSFSSSSSSEIMGTPFDLGAPRFEYPFPPAQGSPTDPFLPLAAAITPHSHSHTQLPPWPIHVSKSFPLSQPPLGKLKPHPKLRSANVREPPVPPGLVKRRSRIAGIHYQSSSEEPSDKSDVGDQIARARRPSRVPGLTDTPPRKIHPSGDPVPARPGIVTIKQAIPFSVRSADRPPVQDPANPAIHNTASAQDTSRPQAVSHSAYGGRHATEGTPFPPSHIPPCPVLFTIK